MVIGCMLSRPSRLDDERCWTSDSCDNCTISFENTRSRVQSMATRSFFFGPDNRIALNNSSITQRHTVHRSLTHFRVYVILDPSFCQFLLRIGSELFT